MDKFAESTAEMREKIQKFESAIASLPQVEIPIDHFFAPGIYLRQMTVQKGVTLTGKIHKTEHLCILAKGSVVVVNETGRKVLSAPSVVHSMPGTKRAIHALEDTVWINVHHNPTDERDEEKIEDVFVTDTYEKFLSFMEQKQIEGGK